MCIVPHVGVEAPFHSSFCRKYSYFKGLEEGTCKFYSQPIEDLSKVWRIFR